MGKITDRDLKNLVSSQGPALVYLIYGEEKYVVRKATGVVMKKVTPPLFPEFNCQEFSGDAAVDAIADAALALPMMAEGKCVHVRDFSMEDKPQVECDKLLELLTLLSESTSLVLSYPTLEFDPKKAKWKKLMAQCEKVGFVIECKRKDTGDLKKLLTREAQKLGCTFSPLALTQLLDYAGQELNQLFTEVHKLCAYVGTGEISPEAVELLTPKTTETTAFLMTAALVARDYDKAYSLMDSLFYQNQEPLSILGALTASYLDMYRVKVAVLSGLKSNAAGEYGEYRGKEFRLSKAERSGKALSLPALRECLEAVLEADLALKGSKLSPRTVLDRLISRLMLIGEKRWTS